MIFLQILLQEKNMFLLSFEALKRFDRDNVNPKEIFLQILYYYYFLVYFSYKNCTSDKDIDRKT